MNRAVVKAILLGIAYCLRYLHMIATNIPHIQDKWLEDMDIRTEKWRTNTHKLFGTDPENPPKGGPAK